MPTISPEDARKPHRAPATPTRATGSLPSVWAHFTRLGGGVITLKTVGFPPTIR